MTNTAYALISTLDLLSDWVSWGADSGLVVYLDYPHQVISMTQDKRNLTVVTDQDVFTIPRGDKTTKMWKVLL